MKATKFFTMIAALAFLALGAAQLASAIPLDYNNAVPRPHLRISSPTITIVGDEWVVQFNVTNNGNAAAQPFKVTVADLAAGGTTVATYTGRALAAYNSESNGIKIVPTHCTRDS